MMMMMMMMMMMAEDDDAIQSLQRQYPTVIYTKLGCVNDDPDFLKILAAWANPQIEAMLAVSSATYAEELNVGAIHELPVR